MTEMLWPDLVDVRTDTVPLPALLPPDHRAAVRETVRAWAPVVVVAAVVSTVSGAVAALAVSRLLAYCLCVAVAVGVLAAVAPAVWDLGERVARDRHAASHATDPASGCVSVCTLSGTCVSA